MPGITKTVTINRVGNNKRIANSTVKYIIRWYAKRFTINCTGSKRSVTDTDTSVTDNV